jgi:hypothetical protein
MSRRCLKKSGLGSRSVPAIPDEAPRLVQLVKFHRCLASRLRTAAGGQIADGGRRKASLVGYLGKRESRFLEIPDA